MFQLALRNLWRHPKRTIFIVSLITLGSFFICFAGSILDGATQGMETTLVGSLTGHLALGAKTEESYGLFGSEVPIVSDYEGIPPLDESKQLFSLINSIPGISRYTSIVSGIANVSINGFSQKSIIFGIDHSTYFSVLKDIEILWGDPNTLNQGGIFLNEQWVKKAEAEIKHPLTAGEKIVAAIASQGTFRLRSFHLAGVYRYKAPSEVLDRIVLADPMLVRSLVNYTLGNKIEITSAVTYSLQNNDTSNMVDDLFTTNHDIQGSEQNGINLHYVEKVLGDTTLRDSLVTADSAAWSFILIRKDDAVPLSKLKYNLVKLLNDHALNARILDWYTAAGSNAMMLFVLKKAFNMGVLFLVIGALMIFINTLVISILERTGEIGTLRAIGAQRFFIIRLVLLEIFILAIGSAIGGVLLSYIVLRFFAHIGISFQNPLLIGLFGGTVLRPHLSNVFVIVFLFGTVIASLLASMYPIYLVLSISPRKAISDEE